MPSNPSTPDDSDDSEDSSSDSDSVDSATLDSSEDSSDNSEPAPPSDTPHVHDFTEKEVWKEASCSEEGEILLKCACGENKIVKNEKLNHVYENGRCVYCYESEKIPSEESSSVEDFIESSEEESSEETSIEESSSVEDFIESSEEESSEETSIEESSSVEDFIESSEEESVEEDIEEDEDIEGDWETGNLIYKLTNEGYICTGMNDKNAWSVWIPNTYNGLPVVGIAKGAFERCKNLVKLRIGANIQTIEMNAIYGNYYLTEVYNNSSITNASLGISSDTTFLTFLTSASQSRLTKDGNGFIIYAAEDGKNYLLRYMGESSNVVIPEGVNEIASYAFMDCAVDKITISASVEKIGKYAFKDVVLQEVVFVQPNGWVANGEALLFETLTPQKIAAKINNKAKYPIVRQA